MHIHTCVHMYTYLCTHIRIRNVYVRTYKANIHMYVCTCTHAYMHAHTSAELNTENTVQQTLTKTMDYWAT